MNKKKVGYFQINSQHSYNHYFPVCWCKYWWWLWWFWPTCCCWHNKDNFVAKVVNKNLQNTTNTYYSLFIPYFQPTLNNNFPCFLFMNIFVVCCLVGMLLTIMMLMMRMLLVGWMSSWLVAVWFVCLPGLFVTSCQCYSYGCCF